METLIDILAKVGGICALLLGGAVFFLREYFSKLIAKQFLREQALEKYGHDNKIVVKRASAELQAKLVEKYFDFRIAHLERISKEAWLTSEALSTFVSAIQVHGNSPEAGMTQSQLGVYRQTALEQLDKLSGARSASIGFTTLKFDQAVKDLYRCGLDVCERLVKLKTGNPEDYLPEFWQLERNLSEEIRAILTESMDLAKLVELLQLTAEKENVG